MYQTGSRDELLSFLEKKTVRNNRTKYIWNIWLDIKVSSNNIDDSLFLYSKHNSLLEDQLNMHIPAQRDHLFRAIGIIDSGLIGISYSGFIGITFAKFPESNFS